jgi:hypothetical protein
MWRGAMALDGEPHGGAWKQRNNGNNGTRDKVTNSQSNNGREETRLHATPQEATFSGLSNPPCDDAR